MHLGHSVYRASWWAQKCEPAFLGSVHAPLAEACVHMVYADDMVELGRNGRARAWRSGFVLLERPGGEVLCEDHGPVVVLVAPSS